MASLGRRDFIRNTAWMGFAAAMVGQITNANGQTTGDQRAGAGVMGFKTDPVKTVKVGVIGLGMRGPGAVHRLSNIPGVEVTALCDLFTDRAERQYKWLQDKGKLAEKTTVYAGSEEAWKGLCDDPNVNLVYVTTPWLLHTPMALYAMRAGKHVAVEVPAAVTLDQCWELVETREKTGRHCMMLENCCYGSSELLALMLCRKGVLGELVHGEGAYIHDLRDLKFNAKGYQGQWRLEYSKRHTGNPYPMHGLGPICQYMNINRGDKMEYLTSISTGQFGLTQFAAEKFGADSEQAKATYKLGDMNTSIIKTYRGRTIMVQHDTTSPRPYSRLNTISGTKGTLTDYPLRVALEPKSHNWMNADELKELREKYPHPLWDKNGEMAKKVGGHGGMDFLMDLRLCYCLQNGLPLDIDVYDTALWSSLLELTERSTLKRGASVDVPDFTRGGWKTADPLGIVEVKL